MLGPLLDVIVQLEGVLKFFVGFFVGFLCKGGGGGGGAARAQDRQAPVHARMAVWQKTSSDRTHYEIN